MCGIIGIIGNKNIIISKELLNHRGPDDSGFFKNDYIFLLHNRLTILDLSDNGHQPMVSEDGKYVIIFNGEIYNHLQIRKELENKYSFKSSCDTETLLYGFIEFGPQILDKLNGIFAFAIYHKSTGDLFLARDPYGVKPLYYFHQNENFAFASELKALIPLAEKKEFDLAALTDFTSLLYSPGEKTPVKGIKKLKAGHCLSLNVHQPEEILIEKYYRENYSPETNFQSETYWIQKLEEKLLAAVDRQLLSDVPVGYFLSGGIDSSTIVSMARKLRPNEKLEAFTLALPEGTEKGFTEDLPYARSVAKHLNVDLIEVNGSKDKVKDFEEMVYHLDEPIGDPAALHCWNISLAAKSYGYKVLLSGIGADEIFSGYRRHQAIAYDHYYNFIPSFLIHSFKHLLSSIPLSSIKLKRAIKFLNAHDEDLSQRLANYFLWYPEKETKKLFNKEYQNKLKDYHPTDFYQELLTELPINESALNKILHLDLYSYSVDNNLLYTDRMSMATGLEVRVPFLDKELVEFSHSIPEKLKLKGTTTKYLLRKVAEKYLPKEIIERPKTGFGAPVRKWITSDFEPLIQKYLSKESIEQRGIFNADAVLKLIEDNSKEKVDAGYTIYALLVMEGWMRRFVDEAR